MFESGRDDFGVANALAAAAAVRNRLDVVRNAHLLDSFLLRSLAIAGYAPSFDECAVCGKPGPHRAFAIAEGGAVCEDCRPSGAASPNPETFSLLSALLEGDWSVADVADARARRDSAGIVAAYTQFHLERKVRSLPLVDRES